MPPYPRPKRSLLARHQWALWLFLALLMGTVGIFWILSRELHIERTKEKAAKTAK